VPDKSLDNPKSVTAKTTTATAKSMKAANAKKVISNCATPDQPIHKASAPVNPALKNAHHTAYGEHALAKSLPQPKSATALTMTAMAQLTKSNVTALQDLADVRATSMAHSPALVNANLVSKPVPTANGASAAEKSPQKPKLVTE
jgi:hypothetical protein